MKSEICKRRTLEANYQTILLFKNILYEWYICHPVVQSLPSPFTYWLTYSLMLWTLYWCYSGRWNACSEIVDIGYDVNDDVSDSLTTVGGNLALSWWPLGDYCEINLVDAWICLMMALLQLDNSSGSALHVFDDSLNTTLWDFFLFTVFGYWLLCSLRLPFVVILVVNSTQAINPWTRCDFCNVFRGSYFHRILNWCDRIFYFHIVVFHQSTQQVKRAFCGHLDISYYGSCITTYKTNSLRLSITSKTLQKILF